MAAGESPTSPAGIHGFTRHCHYDCIWTTRMARCTLGDPARQCTTVVLVLFCTERRVVAMASGFSLPSSAEVESREFESPQWTACATSQSTRNLAGRETSTDGHAPRTSWHGRTGELQDADAVADVGHDSCTLIPCADYDCARGGWRVMRLRLPGAMDGSLCAESVCDGWGAAA
jgi:hypothetical protein